MNSKEQKAEQYAPIAVFTYKRLEKTINALESLQMCNGVQESDLFIFSDGWKNEEEKKKVLQVREYIHSLVSKSVFRTVCIVEQEKNIGLANSIITGVSKVLQQYDSIIVVEDDLVVAPNFLEFMNNGLVFFEGDKTVGAITGYSQPIKELESYPYDIYKSYSGSSWGWATWKDVWENVDWEVKDYDEFKKNKAARRNFCKIHKRIDKMLDKQMNGLIDSWSVRFDYFLWKNSLYTIYPRHTLVRNEGFGVEATHTNSSDLTLVYNSCKHFDNLVPKFESVPYDPYIEYLHAVYGQESIYNKIEKKLKTMIHKLTQWADK